MELHSSTTGVGLLQENQSIVLLWLTFVKHAQLSVGAVQETGAQSGDASRLKDVVSRCNAMASERARATFTAKNLEQDLPRLLKSGNVEQHRDVLDRSTASSALAGDPHGRTISDAACELQSGMLTAHARDMDIASIVLLWSVSLLVGLLTGQKKCVTVAHNVACYREMDAQKQSVSPTIAAVLAFSDVTADSSNFGKFQLALYDTGRYMRLDSAAQRALNVMKQRTDANDNFSLYGLMNRGRTAMARRLLKVQLGLLGSSQGSLVAWNSPMISCHVVMRRSRHSIGPTRRGWGFDRDTICLRRRSEKQQQCADP